jgi:8-amino-7-oxononanoate synthase
MVGKGSRQMRSSVQPAIPRGRGKAPRQRRLDQVRARFVEPFGDLLAQVKAARVGGVYSFYACVDAAQGPAGDRPIVLVANDYLGLSADPRPREAARRAIEEFGTSRCASPLAGGYTRLHRDLEQRLAKFLEQQAVALFASGYQANVGIISALMRRGDLIVTDLFNHASIVDGTRLSGAEARVFQHNSARHLEAILEREASGRRILVIVEGIYSADGDIAALPDLCAVAHAHGALIMVDEAHSLGVLGRRGCGAAEHFGLLNDVDLIMGTMSKSLSSVGGFVAADRNLIDVIRHGARSLIFSAAPPPANAAAAAAALQILETEPERRERLWRNARRLLSGLQRLGFDTLQSETPVIPILVGDPARTLEFTARLRDHGVLVCPAIPPMVQGHLSRVRGHVTAAHDDAAIDAAISRIAEVGQALGLTRASRGPAAARSATLDEAYPAATGVVG